MNLYNKKKYLKWAELLGNIGISFVKQNCGNPEYLNAVD